MGDDGSQVYHCCRWEFTDEQGVKAKQNWNRNKYIIIFNEYMNTCLV